MTTSIKTDTVQGTVLNGSIIILRAHSGVSIDGDEAKKIIIQVEQAMPGDYCLLIDRVNDYSISPVGVYNYLNSLSRLKAIAIVAHRPVSLAVSDIEEALSTKPLKVFQTLATACEWLEEHCSVPT